MLLCWNQACSSQTVGPKFYFRLLDSGWLERAHVVTGFEKRIKNFHLPDVPADSIGHHFTSGAIVRVYHDKRSPILSTRDHISHTHRIQMAVEQHPLNVWGPFIDDIGQQAFKSLQGEREVCLVASGSAACYLLDALQQKVLAHGTGSPVTLLYTCRDADLFAYIVKVVENTLKELPATQYKRLRVILSLTDGGGEFFEKNQKVYKAIRASLKNEAPDLVRSMRKTNRFALLRVSLNVASSLRTRMSRAQGSTQGSTHGSKASSKRRHPGYRKTLEILYSRIDWENSIPPGCLLYVQGAGGVLKQASEMGKAKLCTVITGPIYDSSSQKKRNTTGFLGKAAINAKDLLCCFQRPGARIRPADWAKAPHPIPASHTNHEKAAAEKAAADGNELSEAGDGGDVRSAGVLAGVLQDP